MVNSQHGSTEECSNSVPSKFGGYVDAQGNPNPVFVSQAEYASAVLASNRLHADQIADQGKRDFFREFVNQQQLRNKKRLNQIVNFLSDLSFFLGSFLYFWLVLSQSKDVLFGNDEKSNAVWFLEDMVVVAGESSETEITLYMTYGFFAALLMCAAGILRLFTASNLSDQVPYSFMVFASLMAIASSVLVRLHPFSSNSCLCISIHWFALQAATLLLWKTNRLSVTLETARDTYLRLLGDSLFLLATLGGIVLSYLYLFEATYVLSFPHEILGLTVGSLWLAASVAYLLQTGGALIRSRSWMPIEDDAEKAVVGDVENPQKPLPQLDTKSTGEDEIYDDASQRGDKQRKKSHKIERRISDNSKNDEQSVFTTWTAGPGPSRKEEIARSSLDNIFGRDF